MKTCEYTKQANKFLKDTNTTLDINFKKFGSMNWDKDGQHRNIFECTLINNRGRYTFDFGASVVGSCVKEPKINNKSLKVDVYAGLKLRDGGLSCGVKFTRTVKQLENISDTEITAYADDLMDELSENIKTYNENITKKFNKTYAQEKGLYVNGYTDNGMFIQCVQNAIKRELDKLRDETGYSNDKQATVKKPSSYDILSGLSVSYFEDADDVVEQFGEMKPSQAITIYEQDQELQKLFNEEELELLSEIA